MQNTRKKPVNRGLIVYLSGLAVLVTFVIVMLVINALAVRSMTATVEHLSGVWAEQNARAEQADVDALVGQLLPLWTTEENCRSDLEELVGTPINDGSYLERPVRITDTEPVNVYTYHSATGDAGTVHYSAEYDALCDGVQRNVTLTLDVNFVYEDGSWKIVSVTDDYSIAYN